MGFWESRCSIKAFLVATTVLPQSVEESLALELENSELRHHVLFLSWRLHEVIAEVKSWSKIKAAFCPLRGGNYNPLDCVDRLERVKEEGRQLDQVEFAGGVDVEPWVIEEEVAVVAEKKFVVRLLVAVVELVAGAEVAEDAPLVEVAGKGKEVAVVVEEVEGGVDSEEEDGMVVRRKVRESGEDRRRRLLEEEKDVVRKRMNVWRLGKVVVPNAPLGPRGMTG
ncbi:hypothetical protein HOY80DRAFT_1061592 [Tuber brumale]|nr:hypothetical protein HOY80DRAFT_1061592 [Tuber brumale]